MSADQALVDATYPASIHGRWTVRMPHARAIQYLRDPHWERERIAAMALHIAPTDVIYDIGAEQGDLSALFASWVPQGAMVLAEPNPRSWPSIRLTYEANGLAPPARCWVGFCGEDETLPELHDQRSEADPWPDPADGPLDTSAGFAHLAQEADAIPTIRLDRLAEMGPPPSVITMDVEGSELAVLRGARHTLERHRPLVFVSVHPAALRDLYGLRADDVYLFLESVGYRVIHLGFDHEVHIMAEPR